MPYKDPAKQAAYIKKYEEIRREERRKQKREYWLANRERNLQVTTKRNRKRGFSKREPDGLDVQKRPKVSKVRRWVFIEDRVYFNREIGFTHEEILDMLKMWDEQDRAPVKAKAKTKTKVKKKAAKKRA